MSGTTNDSLVGAVPVEEPEEAVERDFDVSAYLGAKIDEARRVGPVMVVSTKPGVPDQHYPGKAVPLTDLPTMSAPQEPCSATAPHGPHYWQLVRQTTGPNGPVTLCPGAYNPLAVRP